MRPGVKAERAWRRAWDGRARLEGQQRPIGHAPQFSLAPAGKRIHYLGQDECDPTTEKSAGLPARISLRSAERARNGARATRQAPEYNGQRLREGGPRKKTRGFAESASMLKAISAQAPQPLPCRPSNSCPDAVRWVEHLADQRPPAVASGCQGPVMCEACVARLMRFRACSSAVYVLMHEKTLVQAGLVPNALWPGSLRRNSAI